MFKTQILEALKTRFAGVSDKILARIADKLSKTVTSEADVQTAVDGVNFQEVLDIYGDSRATEATRTAVANYEKKHGIKDGKPVKGDDDSDEDPDPDDDPDNKIPKWAKRMLEENKSLRDDIKALRGEKVSDNRKKVLSGILDKLPENLRKGYSRISVENLSDEEFETLKSEIESEVENIVQEAKTKGAIIRTPVGGGSKTTRSGGNDKEATDEEAQAVVDKLGI